MSIKVIRKKPYYKMAVFIITIHFEWEDKLHKTHSLGALGENYYYLLLINAH